MTKRAVSDWSPPNLFEVAAGPTEAEFEAALQVVRSYLDVRGGGDPRVEAVSEFLVPSEPLGNALASQPANPELSVDGEVVADLLYGQSVVGIGGFFGYLLHLEPLSSSDGLCSEDSDRGNIWVRSSTNQSPTGDGFCVCVRKWSTITNDWAYVAEALGGLLLSRAGGLLRFRSALPA